MSIYQKNLFRLGSILIAVSILDLIIELTFYRRLMSSMVMFDRKLQSPLGICITNGAGLSIGAFSCLLHYRRKHSQRIIPWLLLLLSIEFLSIILLTSGNAASRIDGLINTILILSALTVYTALQLERKERNWRRICTSQPSMLDLKLDSFRQWFNPIQIGPKLELSQEMSSVVDHFLATSRESRPLMVNIRCPEEVSEPMQATMQEVFQMYYEDEEQRINRYLEQRYIRVMALVIISIIAMTVWIRFSPSNDGGVTWTILSNFAAFSLWQVGSTYFERSEGYGNLLQAQIAKQAKLHFWG